MHRCLMKGCGSTLVGDFLASIGSFAPDHCGQGPSQDGQVQPRGPSFYVDPIQPDHLIELDYVASARYETAWRGEIGREVRVGSYFRWLGERLSDDQIDRLVLSYRDAELRDLVARHASFERHSRFILALARSPFFWRTLLRPARADGREARAG